MDGMFYSATSFNGDLSATCQQIPKSGAIAPVAEAAPAGEGGQLQPPAQQLWAPASAATLVVLLAGCTSLAEITLPPALTAIGPAVFRGCLLHVLGRYHAAARPHQDRTVCLRELHVLGRERQLPPALTEIEQQAFKGCTSLAEITLPPQQVPIRSAAFEGPSAVVIGARPRSGTLSSHGPLLATVDSRVQSISSPEIRILG